MKHRVEGDSPLNPQLGRSMVLAPYQLPSKKAAVSEQYQIMGKKKSLQTNTGYKAGAKVSFTVLNARKL